MSNTLPTLYLHMPSFCSPSAIVGFGDRRAILRLRSGADECIDKPGLIDRGNPDPSASYVFIAGFVMFEPAYSARIRCRGSVKGSREMCRGITYRTEIAHRRWTHSGCEPGKPIRFSKLKTVVLYSAFKTRVKERPKSAMLNTTDAVAKVHMARWEDIAI